eukprot:8443501-Pyramimonas_sp.AAC.1
MANGDNFLNNRRPQDTKRPSSLWEGEDLDTRLDHYMEELHMWFATTRSGHSPRPLHAGSAGKGGPAGERGRGGGGRSGRVLL